jgi:hypothetical protein
MRSRVSLAIVVVSVALLAACAGGSSADLGGGPSKGGPTTGAGITGPSGPESPVPTEDNPPGDIPDDVAFVPFTSRAGGFTIDIPEGWARTSDHGSVTFTDKLNTVVVSWRPGGTAPTVATVRRDELPALAASERAFAPGDVSTASLPAGPAVVVTYQANSEPNAVTGRQYRLDVIRYLMFRGGEEVAIALRSPVGADNVDPWRIVTQSFSWS